MSGVWNNIVGPNPRPDSPLGIDGRIVLAFALLYLSFLILTKGIPVETAMSITRKKYHISEDALRKAFKEKLW